MKEKGQIPKNGGTVSVGVWIVTGIIIIIVEIAVIFLLIQNRNLKKENAKLADELRQMQQQNADSKVTNAAAEVGEEQASQDGQKVQDDNQGGQDEQENAQGDSATSYETQKRVVAIDPGHQGWNVDMSALEPVAPGSSEKKAKATSGTEGRYSNLAEYQLNLDVALKLRDELEKRGYEVVLTREDNEKAISNSERAQLAAEAGAEVFVRLHADDVDGASSLSGGRAMISTPSNPYVGELYEDSKNLADAVMSGYCKATGFKRLDTIETDAMSGINWSQVPVIILEMGYMSNKHDDLYMAKESNQFVMARGIADGIDMYFLERDR